MFHVMLVLIPLILGVIIISILLFCLLALIVSLVGGTTAALLVKNKLPRNLILVGFAILTTIALLPVLPVVVGLFDVTAFHVSGVIIGMFACIGILSIFGINFSNKIKNTFGKVGLIILFAILLILAIFFAILTPFVTNLLSQ